MESTTKVHVAAAQALSNSIDSYLSTVPPVKVQVLGDEDLSGQRSGDEPGSSEIHLVTFDEDGVDQAFFKPLGGADEETADVFGASDESVAVAEVAAVAVARALGEPYQDLVPATVLRDLGGKLGTLCWRVEGGRTVPPSLPGDQLRAAALLDSLIANQDRHNGNYYFDEDAQRIGLFDHGFTFATPGAFLNASNLLEERLRRGVSLLTPDEVDALKAADLSPLDDLLTDERLQALHDRRDRMIATGTIATGP